MRMTYARSTICFSVSETIFLAVLFALTSCCCCCCLLRLLLLLAINGRLFVPQSAINGRFFAPQPAINGMCFAPRPAINGRFFVPRPAINGRFFVPQPAINGRFFVPRPAINGRFFVLRVVPNFDKVRHARSGRGEGGRVAEVGNVWTTPDPRPCNVVTRHAMHMCGLSVVAIAWYVADQFLQTADTCQLTSRVAGW